MIKTIRGFVPCGHGSEKIVTEWNPSGELGNQAGWDVSPGIIDSPSTGTVDYKGVRVGSLVVVGYFGLDNNIKSLNGKTRCHQQRHRWLVRCTCGRYELRTQKGVRRAIRNYGETDSKVPCCQQCSLDPSSKTLEMKNRSMEVIWTKKKK